MTFYAGFTYLTTQNSAYASTKSYNAPSNYASISSSGIDLYTNDNIYTPIFVTSNNTALPSATNSYTGDYANYIIVNNDTNNWVLTLPLGPGGGTSNWRMGSFLLHIKKTGTGTLTLQTPIDTVGTRIRGINTTSNKSYTLSNSSSQSIILLYTNGITNSGVTDTTAEIWHVIS
jgi:hypothetical protein